MYLCVHIFTDDLLGTLGCTGIGEVAERDVVLSHLVNDSVEECVGECIGLNPHHICPADNIRIWKHLPVDKTHTGQLGFDLSCPVIMSTEYDNSSFCLVRESNILCGSFILVQILLLIEYQLSQIHKFQTVVGCLLLQFFVPLFLITNLSACFVGEIFSCLISPWRAAIFALSSSTDAPLSEVSSFCSINSLEPLHGTSALN